MSSLGIGGGLEMRLQSRQTRSRTTHDVARRDVRQTISQGGESRQIDLRGSGRRSIRKIEFWYDTKGIFKGRANVTVFGMK